MVWSLFEHLHHIHSQRLCVARIPHRRKLQRPAARRELRLACGASLMDVARHGLLLTRTDLDQSAQTNRRIDKALRQATFFKSTIVAKPYDEVCAEVRHVSKKTERISLSIHHMNDFCTSLRPQISLQHRLQPALALTFLELGQHGTRRLTRPSSRTLSTTPRLRPQHSQRPILSIGTDAKRVMHEEASFARRQISHFIALGAWAHDVCRIVQHQHT